MRVPVSALVPAQDQLAGSSESLVSVSQPSGPAGADNVGYPGSASEHRYSGVTSPKSMWTDPALDASAHGGSSKMDADSDDNQPISWQLGSVLPSISHFAGANAQKSSAEHNVKEEVDGSLFKIPAEIPVKRRGRPPTKNPGLPQSGKVPAIKKPKIKKSRRKRLTMPRIGRPPERRSGKVPVRAVAPALNGIPNHRNLTQEELALRLDTLCENCPEELARSLRLSSTVIDEIYKEAEEFRLSVKKEDHTMEYIETLQEQLNQERKLRQAVEDREDVALTESVCDQVLALKLRRSEEPLLTKKSTFFRGGPSDEEIQKTRAILLLPQVEKQNVAEDHDKNSANFFQGVSLPADFAVGSYTVEDLKKNSSVHTVGVSISSGNPNSPGSICNFAARPHPRELSHQLCSLLGKNVQGRAEKRAAQRAKRTAQNETMSEERIEQACFDYLKTSATQPFGDTPLIMPPYHRLVDDAGSNTEAEIMDFYEKFVNSCSCKGGNRCDVCRGAPPTKARLPAATNVAVPAHALVYDYCFLCEQAYQLDFEFAKIQHPRHKNDEGAPFSLGTFFLWPDFLTVEEEPNLTRCINARSWMEGDTGCRRQDYGPTVNYHAQRVNGDKFTGLPYFAQILIQKMNKWKELTTFQCAALSNVELTKERLASVQARVEDEWMWGDRVAILSLNADTVLTFSPRSWDRKEVYKPVRVQIPRRSLVVVTGEARRSWNYSVLSADVPEKQIMMIFRELGAAFREGGASESVGKKLLETAQTYQGKFMKDGKGL